MITSSPDRFINVCGFIRNSFLSPSFALPQRALKRLDVTEAPSRSAKMSSAIKPALWRVFS